MSSEKEDKELKGGSIGAVAAGVGVSTVVAGLGVATNAVLNLVTGENRQPDDKSRLFCNLSQHASNASSESFPGAVKNLFNFGKPDNKSNSFPTSRMAVLFSQHDDYECEKASVYIKTLQERNREYIIKPKTWKTTFQMDIFDAYGATGHIPVHGGLLIAYKAIDMGNLFATLFVDLSSFPAKDLEDLEIPQHLLDNGADISVSDDDKCAVVHDLKISNGIDNNSSWTYKRSVRMSFRDLFDIVAQAMENGFMRGPSGKEGNGIYSQWTNNCLMFKNDILELMSDDKYKCDSPRQIPMLDNQKLVNYDLN